jgi:uncharacterized membrane protein YadS
MGARAFEIPDIVAGAWLGGTLDTSGSVVAAGALISEPAMKVGVIVKFSQNALLGVAAFLLTIWRTLHKGAATGQRSSPRVIWERFPKFVLGFWSPPSCSRSCSTRPPSAPPRDWFALAFICIGLEMRFTELVSMNGGRPAAAFLTAQALNVLWTLLVAFLLFGGILFTVPALQYAQPRGPCLDKLGVVAYGLATVRAGPQRNTHQPQEEAR